MTDDEFIAMFLRAVTSKRERAIIRRTLQHALPAYRDVALTTAARLLTDAGDTAAALAVLDLVTPRGENSPHEAAGRNAEVRDGESRRGPARQVVGDGVPHPEGLPGGVPATDARRPRDIHGSPARRRRGPAAGTPPEPVSD